MASDNSASDQFSELRKRAENALPKRPSDNLEFMQVLKKNGDHTCEIKMRNYDNAPFYALQIRSGSDIPIVFITGYEEGKLIERVKSVTSSTYLIKPIVPKALESAITQALQNNRGLKV